MKKFTFLLTAILVSTFTFGQMKLQPKTVVIFLGPMNPTFSEADYPDLNFYYTPELQLETSKKASDNVDKKAWSSALGVGRTARAEANDSYTGNPTEIVENGIHSGFITLLDSEGIINAKLYLTDEVYFDKSTEFMLKFNGFQRKWEFETFDNLMKTITKKGTAYEKPKKDNKDNEENEKYDIGETFDDFILADKEGNAVNMHSIVQGNTATLVVFLRVNPEYDLNEGKESGKGKKGKSYMNDVAQTVAMEKQIEPLKNLEKGIFGKKQ